MKTFILELVGLIAIITSVYFFFRILAEVI